MADVTLTIAALEDSIGKKTKVAVPFKTAERLTGVSSDDDDQDFLDGINAFLAANAWLTTVHVDWLTRMVTFKGEYVP